MDNTVVSCKDLHLEWDGHPVIKGMSADFQRGEFVYLLGKTGSGKSSFLKSLYADLTVKSGKLKVLDFDLTKIKISQIPKLRRKLGIVFQDFQLLTDRNIKQNLMFVLDCTGWKDKKKKEERIRWALEQVGLSGKEDKFPYELSGGEQQRVCIARAIINDPEIILADEPTGNLDPETSSEIYKLLKGLSEKGKTVLFATHDALIYQKNPSRMLVFENGSVSEQSPAAKLY
ncbi:MAG: ATP-binding cassette domain-containing protein [Bacteroidia bacterium]|nr:ATP-binding cassette domain-containing protein [Bacteroidia bacterium]